MPPQHQRGRVDISQTARVLRRMHSGVARIPARPCPIGQYRHVSEVGFDIYQPAIDDFEYSGDVFGFQYSEVVPRDVDK